MTLLMHSKFLSKNTAPLALYFKSFETYQYTYMFHSHSPPNPIILSHSCGCVAQARSSSRVFRIEFLKGSLLEETVYAAAALRGRTEKRTH